MKAKLECFGAAECTFRVSIYVYEKCKSVVVNGVTEIKKVALSSTKSGAMPAGSDGALRAVKKTLTLDHGKLPPGKLDTVTVKFSKQADELLKSAGKKLYVSVLMSGSGATIYGGRSKLG